MAKTMLNKNFKGVRRDDENLYKYIFLLYDIVV